MNAEECLKILREIRDCAIATVNEQGRPENRIIDVMLVEDTKLYFCTARGKDFYRQIESNPYVAVTGLNKKWQTVRLTGKAEKLEKQRQWIDRIFEENPSMNDVYPGNTRYILEPFCISEGNLEFFDLGVSPIYRESFVIGDAEEQVKGFRITHSCIGCGACERGCPQKCIRAGVPYEIAQENCLHCGRCFENCPVKAIIRMENK